MHHYRQALVQMRLGASDRSIAQSGLMGRRKAAQIRQAAQERGWLDPSHPLPDDDVLVQTFLGACTRPQLPSQVLPHKEQVERWHREGLARHGHPPSSPAQVRLHGQLLVGAPFPAGVRPRAPGGHHHPRV